MKMQSIALAPLSSIVQSVVLLLMMSTLVGVVKEVAGSNIEFATRPWSEFSATIFILPGRQECFYHEATVGSVIHFEYQVPGKDRRPSLNARVKGPRGLTLFSNENSIVGQFSHTAADPGAYEFCVANNHQKYYVKYVQFYLSVTDEQKLDAYYAIEDELDKSIGNMSSTMRSLSMKVRVMRRFQMRSRGRENRDRELLEANQQYVSRWSAMQCIIIVAAASIQIYVLRSLFTTAKYTPTQKPRC